MVKRILSVAILIAILCFGAYTAFATTDVPRVEVVLEPQNPNNVKATLKYFLNPSSEDRLVLTSITMETGNKSISEENLAQSSAYGWFIKSKRQNQLWIGKVAPAGIAQFDIALTIPSILNHKRINYFRNQFTLFLSIEHSKGLPLFINNSNASIVYAPIDLIRMVPNEGFIIQSQKGWEPVGVNSLEWSSASQYDNVNLLADLEWAPAGDSMLALLGFILGGGSFGFITSIAFGTLFKKKSCILISVILALISISSAIYLHMNSMITDQIFAAILLFAVVLLIGPFLPPKVRELISTVNK